MEVANDGREGCVDVVDLNGRKIFWLEVARRDDGRRAALVEQVGFFLVVDQRDVSRLGVAQGRRVVDLELAVANDLSADHRGKLGKGGLHIVESFPG